MESDVRVVKRRTVVQPLGKKIVANAIWWGARDVPFTSGCLLVGMVAGARGRVTKMKKRTWVGLLVGAAAYSVALEYFLFLRGVVKDLDRALTSLTDITMASDLDTAGAELAALVTQLLDAKQATVLVRVDAADEDPTRASFVPIASAGGEVLDSKITFAAANFDRQAIETWRHDTAPLSLTNGEARLDADDRYSTLDALLLHDSERVFGLAVTPRPSFVMVDSLIPEVQRSAATRISQLAALSVLRESALTDPLTGLHNRRYFDGEVARLQPGDAIVFIDLDGFKNVNDRHGHGTGDAVLKSLAEKLAQIVGPIDCAARYGGDEFVALIRGSNGWRARALMEGLARDWRDIPPITTFSGGIAEYAVGQAEMTVARADQALYQAKSGGGDNVVTSDHPREP